MKKIIFVILLVSAIISVPVTANALTDKQKQEIEEIKKNNEKILKQMEEMQKQVEKAKLENQKQMEEIKKKSESEAAVANKTTPVKTEKFNSNEYAKYIPNKDNGKISRIPKKIMDDNELKKYLKDTHSKVERALPKDAKQNAEQIIIGIRKQYPNDNTALANAANGCWIMKHPAEALYIMGVACNNNPTDPDNLNNYAAFLTMSGAPEKAIPILNKLNSKYPDNSTILNNLGQAWFDLGDTQQAEKYLDSAIKLFAYHSQANYTKAIIEAANGNKNEAIAAMKRSLESSYNQDREYKLQKMGGTLDNIPSWGFHMPQDALGLDKMVVPPYPHSLSETKLYIAQWGNLQNACQERLDELNAKIQVLEKQTKAKNDAASQEVEQAAKKFDVNKLTTLAYTQYKEFPPFFNKAMSKMRKEWDEEQNYKKHEEFRKKYDQLKSEVEELISKMHQEMAPIEDEWVGQTGEGMPNKNEPYCSQLSAITDKYTDQINSKWEQYAMEYLDYKKKECNLRAYYAQYTTPGGDDEVELAKLRIQKEYIGDINSITYTVFFPSKPAPCSGGVLKSASSGKLADFYDLHCDTQSKLIFPWVGSINIRCNKMETELNILPIIKGKWTENLETNTITNGTVMLGISTGIGDPLKMGPLKAEAKIGGGAFIEFDDKGITDFGPYAELKSGLGVNWEKGTNPYSVDINGKSVSIGDLPSLGKVGVEARWGWNSGFSAKGTGLLKGIF